MKTAKLFQNGESQAVRLPKDFRFPGSKVFIKKMGNATLLIPTDDPWESLFRSFDEFSEDFMQNREQLAEQKREYF